MSISTVTLPRRRLEKLPTGSWIVMTQKSNGEWIGDHTTYDHKTSAYARLGRLTEQEAQNV